jgi:hypothetical protein
VTNVKARRRQQRSRPQITSARVLQSSSSPSRRTDARLCLLPARRINAWSAS